MSRFPRVDELTQLQIETVDLWHRQTIANTYDGVKELVCRQHECNFRLWHQEDKARNPSATDQEIADVKRAIDQLNQSRNDLIERVDDAVTAELVRNGVSAEGAPINTETPGAAIDRLSIMSLRLYHYREQLGRSDVGPEHFQSVADRISLCEQQHRDLSASLQQLLDDIFAGKKHHRTYRQLKMYNDPVLNPEIYKTRKSV